MFAFVIFLCCVKIHADGGGNGDADRSRVLCDMIYLSSKFSRSSSPRSFLQVRCSSVFCRRFLCYRGCFPRLFCQFWSARLGFSVFSPSKYLISAFPSSVLSLSRVFLLFCICPRCFSVLYFCVCLWSLSRFVDLVALVTVLLEFHLSLNLSITLVRFLSRPFPVFPFSFAFSTSFSVVWPSLRLLHVFDLQVFCIF